MKNEVSSTCFDGQPHKWRAQLDAWACQNCEAYYLYDAHEPIALSPFDERPSLAVIAGRIAFPFSQPTARYIIH